MIFALYRTEVRMSTPFWELETLKFRTRVWCAVAEPFTNWFVFCFFSSENVGSLKTQISPKNIKAQISGGKKKSVKDRQGHIKHVCKISGSNSQKRRGHLRRKEFGVLCLNQPVVILRLILCGSFVWGLVRRVLLGLPSQTSYVRSPYQVPGIDYSS